MKNVFNLGDKNEGKKLQTFDWSYLLGISHFEDYGRHIY